ncbi:MAG TPA: substrate-binding domain-containing protein [Anaeromyxobacter sp.]
MATRHIRNLVPAVAIASLAFSPGARADDPLRASGTGSALGAMRRLAAAFARASPGDRLEVVPSLGTSGAVQAVAHGALDLGFLGRDLEPQEKALGLVALPYARTPFVFVAGPRSGVSGITADDAVRIYRGELAAWPGGERVRLILRPKVDSDNLLLRAISPEMAAAVEAAFAREGMLMAATNQECDEMAARTPGALAPSSLTQILAEREKLEPLAWNDVAPTLANLASGAYPLEKRLQIVFRAPPRPAVRRFLAFLGSAQARKILEDTGNLPLPLPPHE